MPQTVTANEVENKPSWNTCSWFC